MILAQLTGAAAHHHAVLGEAARGLRARADAGGGAEGGRGGGRPPEGVRAQDDAGEWSQDSWRNRIN